MTGSNGTRLALVAGAVAASVLLGTSGALVLGRAGNPSTTAIQPSAMHHAGTAAAAPRVRTYFIAADRVAWDYAPSGRNAVTGKAFDDTAKVFVQNGPDRVGHVYLKSQYRQYTDATFRHLQPRPADEAYLGILGPVIRAQVGDTIKVVFRNNTPFPADMHPHGVLYDKASEGARYDDGTSGADRADEALPPGATHTYVWEVPERAGPGPMDANTTLWMYHGHVDEPADTNAGLIGPIVIGARGSMDASGRFKGVDREVITMFTVFDENASLYLGDNIRRYPTRPASVDPADEGFEESNLMHSINGFVYGNMPMPTMRTGEHVRWYLLGMGTEVDLHTPHWHGNDVVINGMRTDVAELLPMSMKVADMVPDNPGTWLYHCHVNDHIVAGMTGRYQVLS